MCKFLFLTFDWNYDTAYQFNKGVEHFVHEHPDTGVYIFNGFGKYGNQEAISENFEIYNIPDLTDYDGIAIQGNRAWPVEMRMQIVDHARALGLPVVSVNYPLSDCTYIGTDNYAAMKEMTEHLIAEHHISHPVYITGLNSSVEAQDRRKAVLETCHRHGIEHVPVYGGTWERKTGIEAVEQMLSDQKEIPDAIICANDDIAEGVRYEMDRHGIRNPQDYLLTGFDNREISRAASPRITSVDRDYAGMGYTAMDILYQAAHGKKIRKEVYSPYHVLCAGSCGCRKAHETRDELKKNYYELDHTLKNFYRVEDPLQSDLLSCNRLKDVMQVLEEDFTDHSGKPSWFVIDSAYAENPASVTGNRHYSRVAWLCACINGGQLKADEENHVYAEFETHEVLPSEIRKNGTVYVIYPLNTNDNIIGYYVTQGVSETAKYNFLQLVLRIAAMTIEDVRKKYLMSDLNSRLGDLYIKDQLSGVYNRFGLQKNGALIFQKIRQKKGTVWISFVDIDDMKGINDHFGHNCGDMAIHDTAEILKETEGTDECFIMRYGGDEFVVIGEKQISSSVRIRLQEYMKRRKRKYHLGFSIGEYEAQKEDDLESCIRKADDLMYEHKRLKKEKAAEEGIPFTR